MEEESNDSVDWSDFSDDDPENQHTVPCSPAWCVPQPKPEDVSASYVIPLWEEGDPEDTPGFLAAIRMSLQNPAQV